jgi:hypothetical protein
MKLKFLVLFLLLVISCQKNEQIISAEQGNLSFKNLKLIRAQAFDETWSFNNSPLGGISGIVYDASQDNYIAVTDDRGSYDSPRLFVFKISEKTEEAFVTPQKVIYLTHENGKKFQNDFVDLEGITLESSGRILVSNEGIHSDKKREVTDILVLNKEGQFQFRVTPPKYYFPDSEKEQKVGVRDNKGFESLSLSPNGELLFAALEAPLVQDGDRSTLRTGSFLRFLQFKKNGENYHPDKEYVYPLSPVPFPKDGTQQMRQEFKGGNGLVELIAIDNDRLFALERSYSPSLKMNHIDLFEIHISKDATNTLDSPNLKERQWVTLDKYLFASINVFSEEMAKYGVKIDNIEAMALGPKSSSGKQTLLLVSDNNFNKNQKTIFLLFEILR